jgi:hypothetical protein
MVACLLASPPLFAQEPNSLPAEKPAVAPTAAEIDAILTQLRSGANQGAQGQPKKFRDFNEVTQGGEKLDGFFTLWRKDDHVFGEIKPHQFEQPFIVPISIARGLAQAGSPMGFGDEMVFLFRKSGDKVLLVRKNIHYKAPSGTPIEKSVIQNYTDSIVMALPIVTMNPMGGGTLIDFNDIFLTDFAQLGLGGFDRSRSSWSKLHAFPNNVELQVEATYGGGRSRGGDDAVADARGVTVVIHYSLMKIPDGGYRVRYADDRVGHFLSAVKDFGKSGEETNYVRMINRWRLEKADPRAKLSAPKKQIIFYVEDNVPFEYRPFVEEGIREWNKAFEKIGYRDAIAVRWQQPGEEFDPEDTNYNTVRWITTNSTFARSNLRANPLTGEMIDGDVVFDASWIKAWKHDYAYLTGVMPLVGAREAFDDLALEPVLRGEILSPILAAKRGFGSPTPLMIGASDDPHTPKYALVPEGWNPIQARIAQRMGTARGACSYASGMQLEMSLALLSLSGQDTPPGGEKPPEAKLPDELLGQAIKEVTMHEVGHSLGLRHNFKASAMLSNDQLHDTSITKQKGLAASVMDYTPINLAPKGQKQGDYFSTTIGPYDYWAIEYAYKPIDGNEQAELAKIATRAPEADLIFASDEDTFASNDPTINRYDLGADPCRFAKDRLVIASDLLKELDSKAVKDGESWSRNRMALSFLLSQWGNASHLISQYVGGQYVSRHHKGDKDAKDPIEPVPGAKQREALALISTEILSDKAFQFSPQTLRRLGFERWYHWGNESMGGTVDYPIYDRVLGIQRIALAHCLSPDVLTRLQNQELQVDPASNPLKVSEVFRTLTDGIWTELGAPKDKPLTISTIRRNLQREHLKRLASMVLGQRGFDPGDSMVFVAFDGGGGLPADAKSLARLHLKELRDKITAILQDGAAPVDDATKAHLDECRDRINKVLDASLQANGV